MKNNRGRFFAVLLCVSMLLCGCGTPMFEITEEEQHMIATYSAYVLAKYNIYQKDGLVRLPAALMEELDSEFADEEPEDTQTPDEDKPLVSDGNAWDLSYGDALSLAQAVGYEDQLRITYQGFEIADNYKEGKVYSIDPHKEKKFVVAKFVMENITDGKLTVDVLNNSPTFSITVDGERWLPEKVTLLLSDLSTYQGTLEAGACVDTVILFEVDENLAQDISQIAMNVTKDGIAHLIKL